MPASLDDLLSMTQRFINPKASRSGVSRLLRREGMAKLADLQPKEPGQDKPKKTFKDYVPGFVHMTSSTCRRCLRRPAGATCLWPSTGPQAISRTQLQV